MGTTYLQQEYWLKLSQRDAKAASLCPGDEIHVTRQPNGLLIQKAGTIGKINGNQML